MQPSFALHVVTGVWAWFQLYTEARKDWEELKKDKQVKQEAVNEAKEKTRPKREELDRVVDVTRDIESDMNLMVTGAVSGAHGMSRAVMDCFYELNSLFDSVTCFSSHLQRFVNFLTCAKVSVFCVSADMNSFVSRSLGDVLFRTLLIFLVEVQMFLLPSNLCVHFFRNRKRM